MIKNMNDLLNKMKEDAADYQSALRKKRFAIYEEGISIEHERIILKNNPNFPQSYLDCLKKYNVFGVSIGYFSLSPISYDVDNIVDSLLLARKESFLPHQLIYPLNLCWVGNNNNDTIYVAGKNSPRYKEGEVVAIHEFILSAKPEEYARYFLTLAKDFEQFMILAGNLNEVHRFSKDKNEQRIELKRRLDELDVEECYAESWFEYI